ncbi:hypothetical protein HN51_036632, partial [Arachis hypogaea]
MDKDKPLVHGGGLPPPSGRYSGYSPTGNAFNVKSELSSSSSYPPMVPGSSPDSSHFGHGMSSDSSGFSHDISRMPKNPQRNRGHRLSRNEEQCLEDQLGDAKIAVGSAETELKQLKNKISHCEKELKEKTKQLRSKREEAVSVENELAARRKDVENVKIDLESIPYKGEMEALQRDRASEIDCVQKWKDEIRNISAYLSNVEFTYCDPVKKFDRSKVKGVVAKLIKVKDKSTMTALEQVEKLFNVVVDIKDTGKQLLQNGKLRIRVTIIPLNKIQSYSVPARVGKENAKIALSLVGCEEELKMLLLEFIFILILIFPAPQQLQKLSLIPTRW